MKDDYSNILELSDKSTEANVTQHLALKQMAQLSLKSVDVPFDSDEAFIKGYMAAMVDSLKFNKELNG